MKLQKKNRRLHKNPITWLVLLVLVALSFVILEKTHVTDLIKGPAKDSDAQQAEQKKKDQLKKQEFIEKGTDAKPVTPPEDNGAITITTAQEDGAINILTKLKDFAGGSCDLSISNGSKNYTVSAEVIYQPEFSSCAGFSVPISKLGNGQWSIVLTATPSGGSPLTKAMLFEVK